MKVAVVYGTMHKGSTYKYYITYSYPIGIS